MFPAIWRSPRQAGQGSWLRREAARLLFHHEEKCSGRGQWPRGLESVPSHVQATGLFRVQFSSPSPRPRSRPLMVPLQGYLPLRTQDTPKGPRGRLSLLPQGRSVPWGADREMVTARPAPS